MKRRSKKPPWRLLGERINPVDRTIGTSVAPHKVIPQMPNMSWLGEPPTDRQAARYEAKRARLLSAEDLAGKK